MSDYLNIEVEAVDSAKIAVENQPIVSLATSSRSTVIEPDWVAPGALVVSITSGQLPRQTVANSRVIVSWKEELLGGEAPRQPYMAMIADGSWSAEKIAGELGDVILGKIPGRVRRKPNRGLRIGRHGDLGHRGGGVGLSVGGGAGCGCEIFAGVDMSRSQS